MISENREANCRIVFKVKFVFNIFNPTPNSWNSQTKISWLHMNNIDFSVYLFIDLILLILNIMQYIRL